MKAVILAAGRGVRLAPMGWDKPKCLLEFGGQTLLDNIVISLLENNIDEVVIVVGYKQELVLERLKQHAVTFDVEVNKDYAETNTIHSLYLAREHLDDDFIYFNADVLYERPLISRLVSYEGNVFAIDEKSCGAEEVKVVADEERRIVRIGKKLEPEKCLGEFIGIGKFDASSCKDMVKSLCRFNEDLGERDLFFEAAVEAILGEHSFYAMGMDGLSAIEIDSPEDYTTAKALWESKFSEPSN
jgi:choline kinase